MVVCQYCDDVSAVLSSIQFVSALSLRSVWGCCCSGSELLASLTFVVVVGFVGALFVLFSLLLFVLSVMMVEDWKDKLGFLGGVMFQLRFGSRCRVFRGGSGIQKKRRSWCRCAEVFFF